MKRIIVELPDYHGRLIDADRIIEILNRIETSDYMSRLLIDFVIITLQEAPTLVEGWYDPNKYDYLNEEESEEEE